MITAIYIIKVCLSSKKRLSGWASDHPAALGRSSWRRWLYLKILGTANEKRKRINIRMLYGLDKAWQTRVGRDSSVGEDGA